MKTVERRVAKLYIFPNLITWTFQHFILAVLFSREINLDGFRRRSKIDENPIIARNVKHDIKASELITEDFISEELYITLTA